MNDKTMTLEERLRLKQKIEKVLSEILSDKYDCKITIHFKPEPEEVDALTTNSEKSISERKY